jgi:hypothetical protein
MINCANPASSISSISIGMNIPTDPSGNIGSPRISSTYFAILKTTRTNTNRGDKQTKNQNK